MSEERIRCWHFLPGDGCLAHGDGRKVEVGETYSIPDEQAPELCACGMHGSRRVLDAVFCSYSSLLTEVEIWGDVIEDHDKLCGRHRKVLWMGDISAVLHEFACLTAEDHLLRENETDARGFKAIATKRKWVRGEVTDEELSVAREAAIGPASAAAWKMASMAAGEAASRAIIQPVRDREIDCVAVSAAIKEAANARLERMVRHYMATGEVKDVEEQA